MRIKGRLGKIKFKFNNTIDTMLYVPYEDVKFLIEQAERVHELEQQNKNYRKSVKECVERMNAGGAGTRSFVYEKLIKALEGEE